MDCSKVMSNWLPGYGIRRTWHELPQMFFGTVVLLYQACDNRYQICNVVIML
jgi:hypothetical protein